MPRLDMRLAVGMVSVEGEPKIMCGPPGSPAVHSSAHVIIVPGEDRKEVIAMKLAGLFKVRQDRVLSALPPGGSRVIGSHGIDEGLLRELGIMGD